MSTPGGLPDFDSATAEAFAERLLTALNNGALWLRTREVLCGLARSY